MLRTNQPISSQSCGRSFYDRLFVCSSFISEYSIMMVKYLFFPFDIKSLREFLPTSNFEVPREIFREIDEEDMS